MYCRYISPKILQKLYVKSRILQTSFHITTKLRTGNGENVRKALFVPVPIQKPVLKRKVSVIGGAGLVGSTMGYNIITGRYADEVVLLDTKINEKKLQGQMIDIGHMIALDNNPRVIATTNIVDTKNSEVVIMAVDAASKNESDIAKANSTLFKYLVPSLSQLSPNCVFLVLTNPCEVLTYLTWKLSGFDSGRCIGIGTEIDCARFKFQLSKRLGTNPTNIQAYVIGGHGENSVPIWSTISVAGVRLREIDSTIGDNCVDENNWSKLHTNVTSADETIIKLKGYTNWDCSYATERIAKAVLSDAHTIHCVALSLKGHYDINNDCFVSFPAVLGNNGIKDIILTPLTTGEKNLLRKSCYLMEKVLKTIL